MGYPSTISGREFCRRNAGNVSKDQFYEEYYRILHTSYLKKTSDHCIDVIRQEFVNTFGTDPDRESISYIYSTAKYFVYDSVIQSLTTDGKIDSQFYLTKLLVEVGFDAWFLTQTREGLELNFDKFRDFVPLEKSERNKKSIDDFLSYKLPRSKDYSSLYAAILPFKDQILTCYDRLVNVNLHADDITTPETIDIPAAAAHSAVELPDSIEESDLTKASNDSPESENERIESEVERNESEVERNESEVELIESEVERIEPEAEIIEPAVASGISTAGDEITLQAKKAAVKSGVQVNVPYYTIPTNKTPVMEKKKNKPDSTSEEWKRNTKQKQQALKKKEEILSKTKAVEFTNTANKQPAPKCCSSKASTVGKCLLFASIMLVPLLVLTKHKK